jgi:CRISPR-associated protein Cas2
MRHFVISYDISDDSKRNKVSDLLKNYGQRVQYSVFECRLDDKTFDKLLITLKTFVDSNDSIRVYQICEDCLKKVIIIGRAKVLEEPKFFLA